MVATKRFLWGFGTTLVLAAFVRSGVAQMAEQPSGQMLRLSIVEARELAFRQNPSLRATTHAIAASAAQKNEAQAARLPSVSLSARYVRSSDIPDPVITTPTVPPMQITLGSAVLNAYNVTATAQAPLFTGFRLQNRVKAADFAVQAAQADLAVGESEIGNRVEQAYWRLYSVRAAKRTIVESIHLVEAHLADVLRMRSVGLATDDDILAVRVRLSETRLREVQIENGIAMAQATMCNILSLPLETNIVLTDSAETTNRVLLAQTESEQAATRNRPDLRALALRRQAFDRATAAARGNRLPTLGLQANYEVSNPNQRYFPVRDAWHDTWNIGLGLSWTAWDWGVISNQVARTEADERVAEERLRQLSDGIALQVMQARSSVIEASRRIEVAKDGVQNAEAHYRSMRARFTAGTASNTEVLDTENALERAQLDLIEARSDLRAAWSNLDYVTGSGGAAY
jgi:outer membrane protein TolC